MIDFPDVDHRAAATAHMTYVVMSVVYT